MKRRQPTPKRQGQGGYILALSIAVLALMLVGATYIGQRMALAQKLAQAERQRANDDRALENARARVLFLLASVPRSRHGLGGSLQAVALDGRYYRIGDEALVSLQDARGLFGINAFGLTGVGSQGMERLLATYGLDAPAISRLVDTLLDYRDTDGLRRLNGAESEDYPAAKGEAPRNAELLAPGELGRVLGWPEQSQLWEEDPITEHLHMGARYAFNPNTAGWRVLAAFGGLTPEIAQGLVRSRRSGETPDISRLAIAGVIGDPFGSAAMVSLYPGETLIVTLRPLAGDWGYRMAVTHTPIGARAPWRIQYAQRLALPPLGDKPDALPPLPEPATLRDFSAIERLQLPF